VKWRFGNPSALVWTERMVEVMIKILGGVAIGRQWATDQDVSRLVTFSSPLSSTFRSDSSLFLELLLPSHFKGCASGLHVRDGTCCALRTSSSVLSPHSVWISQPKRHESAAWKSPSMPPKSTAKQTFQGPTKQELEAINNYLAHKPDFEKVVAQTPSSGPEQETDEFDRKLTQAVEESIEEHKKASSGPRAA